MFGCLPERIMRIEREKNSRAVERRTSAMAFLNLFEKSVK